MDVCVDLFRSPLQKLMPPSPRSMKIVAEVSQLHIPHWKLPLPEGNCSSKVMTCGRSGGGGGDGGGAASDR